MMDAALIERLAKQSGLYISAELRIFAALIEAQMKERFAKVCDAVENEPLRTGREEYDMGRSSGAERCAAAIRAL